MLEDEMETMRHSTQRERAQLSCQLAQTEEEVRHLKDKVFVLEQRIALETNDQVTVDERIADLMRERTLLERKLEEAHLHLSDIKTSWSGKISSLETQVGRLSRQAGEEGLERRRVEQEKEKLKQRIKQLEAEIEVNNVVLATKDAKLLRMTEDIDEMAMELKELRASVDDEVDEFKRQITGSTSSISGSQVSLDGSKEENTASPLPPVSPKRENSFELKLNDETQLTVKDIKRFENREDEWRKRLAKKETEILKRMEKKEEEWKVKLFEKEKEWKKVVEKQEKEKRRLEEEIKKIEMAKQSLEHALKNAEEYKKKLYSFQEDAEQLEGFQTQEMAKVKHLLLAKEQEVEEKTHHLKIATAEIENLKTEVSRLRRYEDELNNVQESSSKQITQLKSDLESTTSKFTAATYELASLRMSLEKEQSNNSSLCSELAHLRETLESERAVMTELRVFLERERGEKDTALLRNAQISQDIEMVRQENRQHKIENVELQSKVENLEDDLMDKVKEAEQVIVTLKEFEQKIAKLEEAERTREKLEGNERILKSSLLDLEEQLSEKNKTIKVLQQRLTDMKKTLQRELKIPSSSLDSDADASAAILNPSSSKTVTARHNNTREDDVNFKYLKHVLIKFLTSREYEALHLTRAVATLLHFSPEEERLLQETLEWKMSWFGTRPNLGFGQTAKAIPPS